MRRDDCYDSYIMVSTEKIRSKQAPSVFDRSLRRACTIIGVVVIFVGLLLPMLPEFLHKEFLVGRPGELDFFIYRILAGVFVFLGTIVLLIGRRRPRHDEI
jgi:hypothetical protein